MDAKGFPLTIIVYVSSLSVDIKLPNQDRFVSSGEGSGVGLSDISSTIIRYFNIDEILIEKFLPYLV